MHKEMCRRSFIYSCNTLSEIPTLEDQYNNNPIAYIHITEEMFLKKLTKLRNNKSAGPDGIHPCIIKETAEAICSPPALIFRKSLQEGQIHKGWKAEVIKVALLTSSLYLIW